MGEIADMMIGGEMCAWCGVYLEVDAPDVPVLCHDCHSEESPRCDQAVQGMMCEEFYT